MVTLSRDRIREIEAEIDRLLQPLETSFGVRAKCESASYAATYAYVKVQVSVVGESGEVRTREAADFRSRAFLYGLKPDDLGREFAYENDRYKVTGLKPKGSKYPILVQRLSDNHELRFPASIVGALLKAETAGKA